MSKKRILLFSAFAFVLTSQATAIDLYASDHNNAPSFTIPYVNMDTTIVEKKEIIDEEDAEEVVKPLYKKGLEFYKSFTNVPDFSSYAKLDANSIVEYPTYAENFFHLEVPDTNFSFERKIYDYVNVDGQKFNEYKSYLNKIGFLQYSGIEKCDIGDYYYGIYTELMYDPDFKLDKNGVFFVTDNTNFTMILAGKSYTYDQQQKITECRELRIYRLKVAPIEPTSILDYVDAAYESTVSAMVFVQTVNGVRVYYTLPNMNDYAQPGGVSGKSIPYQLPDSSAYSYEDIQSGKMVPYYIPEGSEYSIADVQQGNAAPNNTAVNPSSADQFMNQLRGNL